MTVGATESFLAAGGTIRILRSPEGRVEINAAALQAARLRLSAQVLEMAAAWGEPRARRVE